MASATQATIHARSHWIHHHVRGGSNGGRDPIRLFYGKKLSPTAFYHKTTLTGLYARACPGRPVHTRGRRNARQTAPTGRSGGA